jgi:hypothetical protein
MSMSVLLSRASSSARFAFTLSQSSTLEYIGLTVASGLVETFDIRWFRWRRQGFVFGCNVADGFGVRHPICVNKKCAAQTDRARNCFVTPQAFA